MSPEKRIHELKTECTWSESSVVVKLSKRKGNSFYTIKAQFKPALGYQIIVKDIPYSNQDPRVLVQRHVYDMLGYVKCGKFLKKGQSAEITQREYLTQLKFYLDQSLVEREQERIIIP